MALTFVGGNTGTWAGATTGNNTVSLTALTGGSASAAAAGDLVIAVYATGSTADRTLSITDGTTAYTLIGTELYANGTSYDTNLRVAYKRLTAADTSVTFGPTGNNADAGAAAVYVWRGTDGNTILDVAATTATGTGTGRPTPPAITPTTSGAIIVMAGGGAAATGATYTSALTSFRTVTSADTNDAMLGVGYATWTSGTYTPAQWTGGTTNAADSWAAVTIALRPAGNPSGSLAATETGSDTFASTGKVTIKGSLAATETGSDTFSASGTVKSVTSGTMAPHETGADTASGSGKVIVEGSLSVAETGADTFDSQGSATSGIVGDLHADEAGSDTASAFGTVLVSGQLAAIEQADIFSASGKLLISGSCAASETGNDLFDCQGSVAGAIVGDLHADETGQDTFAGDGTEAETGSMAAYEVGIDEFEASGTEPIHGALNANEAGDMGYILKYWNGAAWQILYKDPTVYQ